MNKEAFLSSERKKNPFIVLLSHHLKADNKMIIRVNVIIVSALQYATLGIEVTVCDC